MSHRETYRVNGMTCQHCAASVTQELSELAGVIGVDVDVATGLVVVQSTEALDRPTVEAAVDEAGYELV